MRKHKYIYDINSELAALMQRWATELALSNENYYLTLAFAQIWHMQAEVKDKY